MPRERISTQYHRQTPNGRVPDGPQFSVEIGWAKDYGSVEVAATAADGTERVVGIVNDWLKAAGREPIDLPDLQEKLPGLSGAAFDGYHVHLENRADVNQLIRVLKRARDAAFGRDE